MLLLHLAQRVCFFAIWCIFVSHANERFLKPISACFQMKDPVSITFNADHKTDAIMVRNIIRLNIRGSVATPQKLMTC